MSAPLNPAKEAELQRLIAEQEADDRDYVSQGHRSLDAPLGGETDTALYEVVDDDHHLDAGPYRKKSGKVTKEQVREWRALRNKEHWTYTQIAEYASVQVKTVRRHLAQETKYKRIRPAKVRLEERLEQFQAAYEAGACLREIAEVHFKELGYKSWQSCYQQLRLSLRENGVALRPKLTLKHGKRSRAASPEVYKRYWQQMNREATKRRRAGLVRCDATVKSGRPCRRFAILGSRFCVNHNETTKRQPKWTKAIVLEALQSWANEHDRAPKAADWAKATNEHPNFKTVTDLFGRWHVALHEAGLRKLTLREEQLARGYHDCAQPGCMVLVAPDRRYCRKRQCQDARSRERWTFLEDVA